MKWWDDDVIRYVEYFICLYCGGYGIVLLNKSPNDASTWDIIEPEARDMTVCPLCAGFGVFWDYVDQRRRR